MSNKELQAQNAALTAEKAAMEQKIAELTAQLTAAQTTIPAATPSKSKQQAEQAWELLQKGPVTIEQLRAINQKYPNDPIYFVRTVLKKEVVTNRVKGGATTYSLPAPAAQPPVIAPVIAVAAASAEAPKQETPAAPEAPAQA